MRKSFSILIALFISAVMLQLLHGCSGCCGNQPQNCVHLNTIVVRAMDNSDSIAIAVSDKHVQSQSLLLRLSMYRNRELCSVRPAFSLINEAYATFDCGLPEDIRDSVSHLTITSNKTWDEDHVAGSDLTDFFEVPELNKENYTSNKTDVDMIAKGEPADSGTHVFTVKLYLTNGDEMTASTEPVHLIK